MNLGNMKLEELELLSYTDLTEMILKESKGSMNTPSIFKRICELLGLSDEDYQNKIGDYYTSLTTDKRFVHLDNAEWDLRDRHKVEIIDYEEDDMLDEEEIEEAEDEVENDEELEEDLDLNSLDDEVLDTDDNLDDLDDLDDLSIIDDEEIPEE